MKYIVLSILTTIGLALGQINPVTISGEFIVDGGEAIFHEPVIVQDGGTLTLNPGSTLFFGVNDNGVPAYLLVEQGGQILAMGTEEAPVTLKGLYDLPGSWGGVILTGHAPVNSAYPADLSGIGLDDVQFGGNDPEDSSGILKHVRIWDAGAGPTVDIELAALTLAGVGRGTTIEYLDLANGLDDGLRLHGGTANMRYLSISAMSDDGIDVRQGYQGFGQHVFIIQDSISPGDKLIDLDSNGPSESDLFPRTFPYFSNLTLLANSSNDSEGIRFRNGASGFITNTIMEHAVMEIEPDLAYLVPDSLNTSIFFITYPGQAMDGIQLPYIAIDSQLRSSGYPHDPRPRIDSPVNVLFDPSVTAYPFFDMVSYSGAFGETLWVAEWTWLAENGWLVNSSQQEEEIATAGFAVDASQLLALGLFDPGSDQMTLAGDFTEWQRIPMELAPDSIGLNYFTLLDMEYGEYQYKFVIDYSDGTSLWEEGENRTLVADEPFILLSPESFRINGEVTEDTTLVTFLVDMNPAIENEAFNPLEDQVTVVGGFGDLTIPSVTLQETDSPGIYAGEILLPVGYYEYQFAIMKSNGTTSTESGMLRNLVAFGAEINLPLTSFTITNGQELSGWTFDATTGTPIPEVLIQIMPLDPGAGVVQVTFSDAMGAYSFPDVAPVPHLVMMEAEGYQPFNGVVDFPQASQFNAFLQPASILETAVVSGYVLMDSVSLPVIGTLVAAVSMDNENVYSIPVGSDGYYELVLPPDDYIFLALALIINPLDPDLVGIHFEYWENAYDIAEATPITLGEGQMLSGIDFGLPFQLENVVGAGNMLMGNLSHAEGASVAGSTLTLLDEAGQELQTTVVGPDGQFSFSELDHASSYQVQASHADFGQVTTDISSENLIDVTELEFGVTSVVGVEVPQSMSLSAYPNPFNPTTTIRYSLPADGPVQLEIYDVLGNLVYSVDEALEVAGNHEVPWEAIDNHGNQVPTGVYFVQISTSQERQVMKVLLLK